MIWPRTASRTFSLWRSQSREPRENSFIRFEYQKKATFDLSYTTYGGGRTFCGTDNITVALIQLLPDD